MLHLFAVGYSQTEYLPCIYWLFHRKKCYGHTNKRTVTLFEIDNLIFKSTILLCRCPKVSLVVEKDLTMENHIFSVPHRHVEDPDKQDI